MSTEQEYSISELADLAGVTPRTVRYYISIGLLPSPGQAGSRTTYSDAHLARVRLIRKLQREHLPLGEIGSRLAGLDDEAVEQALETDTSAAAPGSALEYIRQLGQEGGRASATAPHLSKAIEPARSAPAPPAASEIQRTQWERIALSDNVELHIRRPLTRREQKRIERLIRVGRELLEEGDPS